jgi:hypothetical protein
MGKDRYAAFAAKRDIDIYVNAAFAASRDERVKAGAPLELPMLCYGLNSVPGDHGASQCM